jgi:predicted nucleic acid-binding Zn ribbon protein
MTSKFDGATPEELTEYVEGSAQRAGETDSAWATRVQLAEAQLLAKVQARGEGPGNETNAGY